MISRTCCSLPMLSGSAPTKWQVRPDCVQVRRGANLLGQRHCEWIVGQFDGLQGRSVAEDPLERWAASSSDSEIILTQVENPQFRPRFLVIRNSDVTPHEIVVQVQLVQCGRGGQRRGNSALELGSVQFQFLEMAECVWNSAHQLSSAQVQLLEFLQVAESVWDRPAQTVPRARDANLLELLTGDQSTEISDHKVLAEIERFEELHSGDVREHNPNLVLAQLELDHLGELRDLLWEVAPDGIGLEQQLLEGRQVADLNRDGAVERIALHQQSRDSRGGSARLCSTLDARPHVFTWIALAPVGIHNPTVALQVVVDSVEGFHFQRVGICSVSMVLVGIPAVSKPDLRYVQLGPRFSGPERRVRVGDPGHLVVIRWRRRVGALLVLVLVITVVLSFAFSKSNLK